MPIPAPQFNLTVRWWLAPTLARPANQQRGKFIDKGEMKTRIRKLTKHRTHQETALKFILLLVVLLAYFGYLSFKYDAATGGLLAVLTWSFFVMCTPVADAGFLLDFPIRLLFNIRMLKTEIAVWALAIGVSVYGLLFAEADFEKTFITSLFKQILLTPFPYWSIILLSGIGTFLSIYFGDEMLDVLTHREREKYHRHGASYRFIAMLALFLLIFLAYYYLLGSLGIEWEGTIETV